MEVLINKDIHIISLYSGSRKLFFRDRDVPDTQLYGMNHLKSFFFKVEYIGGIDTLPNWMVYFFGFRLVHLFTYRIVSKYDIAFGASLLYPLFLKKILGGKTKYVLCNTSLNRILKKYSKKSLKGILIRWILSGAAYIVHLSAAQQKKFKEVYKECVVPMSVVPLGVDELYHTANYFNRDTSILSVGRDNGRDYRSVFELARLLPDRHFVVVCSERNIKDFLVPKNVTVHIDIPYSKLRELYHTAGVLLLCTHEEDVVEGSDLSGQTVLLDAMASGLPVIITNRGYVSEYIKDNSNGLVVDPYDLHGIQKALEKYFDSTVRLNIAQRARKTIEDHFSTRHMGVLLEDIFKIL
jgi:glycosyltransferase involved in cell wall biosynthesis